MITAPSLYVNYTTASASASAQYLYIIQPQLIIKVAAILNPIGALDIDITSVTYFIVVELPLALSWMNVHASAFWSILSKTYKITVLEYLFGN